MTDELKIHDPDHRYRDPRKVTLWHEGELVWEGLVSNLVEFVLDRGRPLEHEAPKITRLFDRRTREGA